MSSVHQWWGGVFERMVRSTKRCLRKMIGRASFTRDELLTAVVEIEAVINSRPLSYVSATDVKEPLTPSHLILGRRLLSLPDYLGYSCEPGDEDFEVSASKLTKRMKHFASVFNHFWRRWRSEYLKELRESHHHGAKSTRNTHITNGEVVIVHDESLPRELWKLGRVQEVIPGADGLPRCALVRVASRDKQHTLLKRPVQLLYPLEISQPEHADNTLECMSSAQPQPGETLVTCESVAEPVDTCEPARRPVRAAAKKAAEKRRVWVEELQNQD